MALAEKGPSMTENHAAMTPAERRQRNAERARAYRSRQRRGVVWAWIEIDPRALAGLERLALLPPGERGLEAISEAVARFVQAAAPLAAVGDAIWPDAPE
jgi:phenylpropionate dioxygenase-like ring-hydroxylating dioxygenase large terminal subunit